MAIATAGTTLPRYEPLDSGQGLQARFSSDHCVGVAATRQRSYPGLSGPAPDTRALYEGINQMFSANHKVLDLGCGSGMGLKQLSEHFGVVHGVDSDLTAVEFARQFVAGVEVRHEQSAEDPATSDYDLVAIVDVLGQVDSPAELIRKARCSVKSEGRVLIAEPRAYPSQSLLPPVGRAFSKRGLAELLPRSGLELVEWVDSAGGFVVCTAKPSRDVFWKELAVADRAHRRQEFSVALAAYQRVAEQAEGGLRVEGAIGCAVVLADLRKFEQASEFLLQAAELRPDDARPLAGLAEVCLLSGEPVEALQLAVRAVELDECYLPGTRALARAAEQLQHSDALTTWRLANSLAPGDLQTAIELARLSAEQGEMPYAIWVLERAREFCGELGCDFHVTLAWLLLGANRVGEAQVEAEIARVQQPESEGVVELWAHLQAQREAS